MIAPGAIAVDSRTWWAIYRATFGETAYRFMKGLLEMAGAGKKFNFHGSFASKSAAMKKEAEVPNSFIVERHVKGKLRFFVLTEK